MFLRHNATSLLFLISLFFLVPFARAMTTDDNGKADCISRYVVVASSHDGLAYEVDAAGKRTGRMLGKALYGEPLKPKKCFVPIKVSVWEVLPIGNGVLESHVKDELWDLYCKYPEMIAGSETIAVFILNNNLHKPSFRACVEKIPAAYAALKASKKISDKTEIALLSELHDVVSPKRRWMDVALAAAGQPVDEQPKLLFRPTKGTKFSYGEHGLYVTKEGKDSWGVPLYYDTATRQLKSGRGALLPPKEVNEAFQALCEKPEAALAEHTQLVFLLEKLAAEQKDSETTTCAENLADAFLTGVPSTGSRIAPDNALRVEDLGAATGAIKQAILKRFAEKGRTILPLPQPGPQYGEFYVPKPGTRFAQKLTGETYLLGKDGTTTKVTMFEVGLKDTTLFNSDQERTAFLQEWYDHLRTLDPLVALSSKSDELREVREKLVQSYLEQGEGAKAVSFVRDLLSQGKAHEAAKLNNYVRVVAPNALAWEKLASDELAPGVKVRKDEPACRAVCDLYDSYGKEWGQIRYGFHMEREYAGSFVYAATSLQTLFAVKAARYCAKRKEGAGYAVVKEMKEKLSSTKEKAPSNHFDAYATHFALIVARDEENLKEAKELEQRLRTLARAEALHKEWVGGSALQTYGLSSILSSLGTPWIPSADTLGKSADDPTSVLMTHIEANLKHNHPGFSFDKLTDPDLQEQALDVPYQFNDPSRFSSKCDSAARNVTTYMALYRSDPVKFKPVLLRVLENFRDYRGSLVLDFGRENVHQGSCGHASYYWGPTLPYAVDFLHWLQKNEKWTPQELARLNAVDQSLQGALETAASRAKIFSPKERESMGPSATWEIPLAGLSMLGYIKECNGVPGDGVAFLHDWSPKEPLDKELIPHDIAQASRRPAFGQH